MATKIERIRRGLKAAAKAFKDRDKPVIGVYRVAGYKIVCPVCGELKKRKNATVLDWAMGEPSGSWFPSSMSWTLTCTCCSHVQMFATEPEDEKA
jgi:hypothetical protein